jgi:hypothetical protein
MQTFENMIAPRKGGGGYPLFPHGGGMKAGRETSVPDPILFLSDPDPDPPLYSALLSDLLSFYILN